jgi:tetratricopeptide (TPR) repeat protein
LRIGDRSGPNPQSAIRNALDCLEQLRDASLVLAEPGETEMRFRLLETLREFGGELLSPQEWSDLSRQHAAYFLALAERGEPELRGPDQAAWFARLEREHDNLRAALNGAEERGEVLIGLRLAAALEWFWSMQGYWTEGRDRLTRLLAQQSAADTSASVVGGTGPEAMSAEPDAARTPTHEAKAIRARALTAVADFAGRLSADRATLTALYEESLQLWRELGNQEGIADALGLLGGLARSAGDLAEARSLFEQSLDLSREQGYRRGIANVISSLAWIDGDLGAVRARYQEALAIWRELGEPWQSANALSGMAHATFAQGDLTAARALYEEALAARRSLGTKLAITWSLTALANVAVRQEDYEEARARIEECLTVYREMHDLGGVTYGLNYLGEVARLQNDYARAAALYTESLALHREIGDLKHVPGMLANLGFAAVGQADAARARAFFAESLTGYQEREDRTGIALCLIGLAGVFGREGRPERAARLFGAVEALLDAADATFEPADQADHDRLVAATRAALGEEAFAVAWAEGRALSAEAAIALAKS